MPLRGTHKLDEFEIVEVIGSGQYGVCKKVRKKPDGKVILKRRKPCILKRTFLRRYLCGRNLTMVK